MRLSRVVELVRSKLNEPSTNAVKNWTDEHITRWISEWVRTLVAYHVDADPSYFNYRNTLLGADSTKVFTDVHSHRVPRWWGRIRDVKWAAPTTERAGRDYLPRTINGRAKGWVKMTSDTIEVSDGTTAEDLHVMAVKTPAELQVGAIPTTSATETVNDLFLEAESTSSYAYETEPNMYVNAVVEVTVDASPGANGDPVGQVKTVIASERVWDTGLSEYLIKLTVDPPWSSDHTDEIPVAGSTYEFHPEIEDAYINYLVLRVAESIYQEDNNVNAIQAIQPQLRLLHDRFINGIQPVQDQYPMQIEVQDGFGSARRDPDKDPSFP